MSVITSYSIHYTKLYDIVQGYGMTETSPIVSANRLESNDPMSVGRPLPGVMVRIGENRELQVKGPSVMQGYWHRDEDTARVLTPDGWLGTGDQAEILDGRIYIRGRIKDRITSYNVCYTKLLRAGCGQLGCENYLQ